jgi:membrane fusion protein (multidrug efflux system)
MSLQRKSALTLLIPFAFAVLLGGCSKGGAGQDGMPSAMVSVVEVRQEAVTLTRELPGRTTPYAVAEIRPQISGIVKDRLFEEGARVEAGQVLYQIDDATYKAAYDSAAASLNRAEATLALARTNANRTLALLKDKAVSQQDGDDAVAALRQAEADEGVARAALNNAKIQLDRTKIVSPITGYIGKSAVTKGALVTENQENALATVRQLDPIYIDVTQSSREMLEMRREMDSGTFKSADSLPVAIVLEDGSAYPQRGKLAFSEATVDETTGATLLRVQVANPDRLLLPGMYVRATVGMGMRPDALLVPQRAVTRSADGVASLMIVNEKGVVEPREVTLGPVTGNRWIVEKGLNAGDRVIVDGLQFVGPGMPVSVDTPATAKPEQAAR